MSQASRARHRAASEEGFALIEVVVSASVLVLVVLGVLAGMDAVSGTAAANQARTVAAALAEQDQERLRALRTQDLNQLSTIQPAPRAVRIGAVTYTVASEARWVTDASDEGISCSVAPGQGSYLRISSTVTSPITGAKVRPVVLTSIVAPQPGKGTLTALVKNVAGEPIQGLTVTATGPTAGIPIVTNAEGCAVFEDREAGAYVVKLGSSAWVDSSSSSAPEKGATVSAGNLSTVEFVVDQAASFVVQVQTKVGVAPPVLDPSTGVIAAHTGMPTTLRLQAPVAPATTATSFAFTSMFPFDTPYQLYSGSCAGNNPTKWPGNANYFTANPGAVVQLTPGAAAGTRFVREPALDITVSFNGLVRSNARVYAYPKTADCPTDRIDRGLTDVLGKLAYPGLPFGTYDLCAHYLRTSSGTWYRVNVPGVQNIVRDGTAVALSIPRTTAAEGQCA